MGTSIPLRPHVAPPLALDAAARRETADITSAVPDRAGDVVVPAGLKNAEEFLLNPVVLWAHQRTLPPVGTCVSLDIQPSRVVAVTRFAAGVPLADDVFRLYEQGVLRGWSVGLLPHRVTPRAGRGVRIDAW